MKRPCVHLGRWIVVTCIALFSAGTSALEVQLAGPYHAATVIPSGERLNPYVLLVGGDDADGNPTTAMVLYKANGTPVATGDLLVPRSNPTATWLRDGRVLVVGGVGVNGQPLDTIELVELSTSNPPALVVTASPARLAIAREGHEALGLFGGGVLIRGGYVADGSSALIDELFVPATQDAPDTVLPADPDAEVASVSTDKPDYMPTEWVTVTGGRWHEGEDVHLLFDETPLPRPPRVYVATADGAGQVNAPFALLVEQYDLGKDFTLHAIGASGVSADTYFTDNKNLTVSFENRVDGSISAPAGTASNGAGIACPAAGGLTCMGTYGNNDTVTLTATKKVVWALAQNGLSVTTLCTTPSTTCSIALANNTWTAKATFASLSVTQPASGGKILCGATECATGTSQVDYGASVTLTASPTTGYTLGAWSGCTSSSGTTCNVTLDGAKAVSASFVASNPTLSVTQPTGGTILCGASACPATASYAGGTSVTLTASASGSYTFARWTGDCAGTTGTSCTVQMTAARSVSATFDPNLTSGVTGNGSGSLSCGAGSCNASYARGTNVTFSATVPTGSTVTSWTVTGGATVSGCTAGNASCVVTVTQPTDVRARIDLQKVTLTSGTTGNGGGSLSCGADGCAGDFDYGTQISFAATVPTGSTLTSWTVTTGAVVSGCTPGNASCVVKVATQPTDVRARIDLQKVTLTSDTTGNGGGSLSCGTDACAGDFDYGTQISFAAIVPTGSTVTGWTVTTGAVVSGCTAGNASCVVKVTTQPTDVHARIDLQKVTLTSGTTGNGGGSLSCGADACAGVFDYGKQISFAATIPTGSTLTSWTVTAGAIVSGCTAGNASCVVKVTTQPTDVRAAMALQKLTLSVAQPTGGAILCGEEQCPPTAHYDYGTELTLTAAASAGYDFAGWPEGSICASKTATCAVTLTASADLTASFAVQQKTLTIAQSKGGSIQCGADACLPSYTHPSGTKVTLVASPAEGYSFAGWAQGSRCADQPVACTFDLTDDASVTATFTINRQTLSVTQPPRGGSILCGEAPCGASVGHDYGTEVTLTASRVPGYAFEAWTGACATATGASCTVVLDGDKSVGATFKAELQDFGVSYAGDGSGSVTCDGGTCAAQYAHDWAVVLEAKPALGSRFVGWTNACGGTDPLCSLQITGTTAVIATFERISESFRIDTVGLGTGSFTCDGEPCLASYPWGTLLTIGAVPADGSTFAGWSNGCTGTESCSVFLDAPKSVTARFDRASRALSFGVTAGEGSFTCNDAACQETYPHGTVVRIAAVPGGGFRFASWGGACSTESTSTCEVTLSADRTVSAAFTSQTQTLALGSFAGSGSFTCNGAPCAASATYGLNSTVRIVAKGGTGYLFGSWSGACSGTTDTCDVVMTGDKTFGAAFTVDPSFPARSLTASAGSAGGTVTAALQGGGTTAMNCRSGSSTGCTITVPGTSPAQVVVLTPTAAAGYRFTGWNSACAGFGTGACQLSMLGSVSVTATFQPESYPLTVSTAAPKGAAAGTIVGTLDTSEVIRCKTGSTGGCSAAIPNPAPAAAKKVTLTATADDNSLFWGWSGSCANYGRNACTVTMSMAASATANFVPSTYPLTVQTWGAGQGKVSADGFAPNPGVSCETGSTASCTMLVPNNLASPTQVTLKAEPKEGSKFVSWTGCVSTTAYCTVPVSSALYASATFEPSTYALSVSVFGSGSGTVNGSTSAGAIACTTGSTSGCSVNVGNRAPAAAESITLIATPTDQTSVFSTWSGCTSVSGNRCTISMLRAAAPRAYFTKVAVVGSN